MVKTFEDFRKEVSNIKNKLALHTARLPVQKGYSKPSNIKAIANSSEPRVVLHLEDAVIVLYSPSSTSKQSSSDMTRNETEAMVQEKVHKALLAFGVTSSTNKSSLQRTGPASSGIQNVKQSNKKRGSKNYNGNSSRKNEAGNDQAKTYGFCFNCGATNHHIGSKECSFRGGESFLEIMNHFERESSQKRKTGDKFFHPGSTPSSDHQA
ncbi:hypothetical protein BWQ96_08590 [Gracilariopsis chorda]|uniref:Uncharacterized protein n=1 Tax=Gracilariopsis chorda TaxID=448386 RepID=A0A2V3IHX1_9FLOR|nr:hypothetical protein BWQ96_08590 [Gracilariopsis chorda]|eukprot:PXF41705.1 hypothetical protein BWQ96_08590 [Gracilariopsis chorda]